MISVTEQKPWEELEENLKGCGSVYVVGCGTCTTMQHTGGKAEVLSMKEKLEGAGKNVTGWMVIPTACDILTKYAVQENAKAIEQADCILVMTCAFGVQTVNLWADKPTHPALNTLYIGKEEHPNEFSEVCKQCGDCVLSWTGGICPVTICPKGLLNGPCGGTNNGKCEVDSSKDCAWTLIYNKLKEQGRLDLFEKEQAPKNHQAVIRPGKITLK
jgi:hypothetical protein